MTMAVDYLGSFGATAATQLAERQRSLMDPNTDQPADEPVPEDEMTPPPHEWPHNQDEIDRDAADEVPTS